MLHQIHPNSANDNVLALIKVNFNILSINLSRIKPKAG